MNDEILQSGLLQKLLFLIHCIEQLDAVVAVQNHPRMREKRQDKAFITLIGRSLNDAVDDFSVADMYAVERSDSGYGFSARAEVSDRIEDVQGIRFTPQI